MLSSFPSNPNALWLLLFILEVQPQRLSESLYNQLITIIPTSSSFPTILVFFSLLTRWNEQRIYDFYKSIRCDSESNWAAWMLGVSNLICKGSSSSRIYFLHVLMKSSYQILKPIVSNFSSRSANELKLDILEQTPSVLFPTFEPSSPFSLTCLSSLFASISGIQKLIPSLASLLFSLACEFTKPQMTESLRVFGLYHLCSFLCTQPLDSKSVLRGRSLLMNGANYESKLNRSEVCVMMCNLALNQFKDEKKCEEIIRKNDPMNKKWMISGLAKIREYSKVWKEMYVEKEPEFQTYFCFLLLICRVILFQLNQLFVSSKPSERNPLLSLPPEALNRQFWHHFYQRLHQGNPDPIALQALVTSMRVNRLPSSGDLTHVCKILTETCLKAKWWKLLEMSLDTAAAILQKSGIIIDNLLK